MSTHKFDPAHAKKLDEPSRLKALPPDVLVGLISVIQGDWADIGCGTGNYTIALAKRAAMVTGIDISKTMLEALRDKTAALGIENVGGVLSSESSVPVPDASFDGITLFFVAHEVDELPHFLKEMHRILRPTGQLIVVDFDPDSSVGPPANHRLAVDTLVNALEKSGFSTSAEWTYESEPMEDGRVAVVYGLEAIRK